MSMEDGTYAAERTRTGKWGEQTKPIIVGNDVRTIEVQRSVMQWTDRHLLPGSLSAEATGQRAHPCPDCRVLELQ